MTKYERIKAAYGRKINMVDPAVIMERFDCAPHYIQELCREYEIPTYSQRVTRERREAIANDENLGQITDHDDYWFETYGAGKALVRSIRAAQGIPPTKAFNGCGKKKFDAVPVNQLRGYLEAWQRPSTYPTGQEFMAWRRT